MTVQEHVIQAPALCAETPFEQDSTKSSSHTLLDLATSDIEEPVFACRHMGEDIIAQYFNPKQAFKARVRLLNHMNCHYFETAEIQELIELDVDAACEHFNQCYQNPAEFTICLTGQLEVTSVPQQYPRGVILNKRHATFTAYMACFSHRWFWPELCAHNCNPCSCACMC